MDLQKKVIEILNYAIRVEKDGLITYLNAARKAKDVGVKNMFISLARDEYHHMEILEKERDLFLAGKTYEPVHLPSSEIEKLIPRVKEAQKKRGAKGEISEIEVLNVALDQEKRSRDYYLKEAESLPDDCRAKKLLYDLAHMEQMHYDLILAQLDYIKGTGFWFDMPEFTLEL